MPFVCLVFDPDCAFGLEWKERVRTDGSKFVEIASAAEGLKLVAAPAATPPHLIIASAKDETGLSVSLRLREANPTIPIFLLASEGSEHLAILALRSRIDNYFRMPADTQELERAVRSMAGLAMHEAICPEGVLLGSTEVMLRTKAKIARIAASDSNVLITGETGTGKELAATVIHEMSGRRSRPFVCVNCAAIPDSLIESEMFGYERGAFTGAVSRKMGWLEAADRGTLFLDEIGDLSPVAQAKLLRVIENKSYYRLGGHVSVSPKVRFLAATHRNLETMAADGQFRHDLFYRLNIARVDLPPLREHRDDIPLLVHHYIQEFNRGRCSVEFTDEVWKCLMQHDWPGNIRELKNFLEGLAVNATELPIDVCDLPPSIRGAIAEASRRGTSERDNVLAALLATKWNKSKAAQRLHWSRMTLYRKLHKYQLAPPVG